MWDGDNQVFDIERSEGMAKRKAFQDNQQEYEHFKNQDMTKKKETKTDNLELWNRVEKTDPDYTKPLEGVGFKATSIAPQHQIKQATIQWGVYGSKWGFKSMEFDYSLAIYGLLNFKAVFYFPEGEFEIVNSVSFYKDNAQTKINDNFAKIVETDTLTKALSKLGFNADIFLGKFDDPKYVEMLKAEKEPQAEKETGKLTISDEDFTKTVAAKFKKHIQVVLDDYQLTTSQRKVLEGKLKLAT